jgi:Ca2+-binding EF-hand superfamily protein
MAENLTEEQLADYKLVFSHFDRNNDGSITLEELKLAIDNLGYTDMTDRDTRKMMQEMDIDGNGEVDFAEFLALMAKRFMKSDNEEEIIEAFKVFDVDKNGEISAEELTNVLMSLGEKLTREECDEIMKIADTDGDHSINYREFVKLLLSR